MKSLAVESFRRLFLADLLVDGFDRKLDWAVDEPFVRHKPPPILYHYTSWGGFQGIVRDRAFRATAHGSTNDPKELRTVDALACRVDGHPDPGRSDLEAGAEWVATRKFAVTADPA